MKAIQYTIRNVPSATDRHLRKLARLSGKSLNEVVVEELAKVTNTDRPVKNLSDSLDWFIGSGIDEETLEALDEDDRQQKELTKKEWGL